MKNRGQRSRRDWLLAGLGLSLTLEAAEPLSVTSDGDTLHVTAPRLRFLTGPPLDRLKNGATVVFLSQLVLLTDDRRTIFRRVPARFAISYDLWEEKFSVARLGPGMRSVSHLTASAAESWCLENLSISASGLPAQRPFHVRLELRAADAQEETEVVGEPGINLTRLVEIFSRRPSAGNAHHVMEAGPLRLADLKRTRRTA